jgi:hypothetical protein
MVIKKVLEQYQAHELHWSADLVIALEKTRPGLALDWAAECARSLVAHAAPPESRTKLFNWVNELSQLRSTADVTSLLETSNPLLLCLRSSWLAQQR